jgi:hypothetical protein
MIGPLASPSLAYEMLGRENEVAVRDNVGFIGVRCGGRNQNHSSG